MPKPTLLQTLLGRPSQSYALPPPKDYHSAKNDLIRAADDVPQPTAPSPRALHPPRPPPTFTLAPTSPASYSPSPSHLAPPHARRPRLSRTHAAAYTAPDERVPGRDQQLLRPSRSLIRQIASPRSPSPSHTFNNSLIPPAYLSPIPHPSPPPCAPVIVVVDPPFPPPSPGTPDSADDVFYTPRSSLFPDVPDTMLLEPQALATALLPIHGRTSLKAALAPPELSRGFTPSPTPEQDPRTDGAVTPGPPSRSSSETEPHSASVSRTPSGSSLSSCASAGSTSLFDAAAPSVLSADTRVTTPAVSDAPPKSDDSEHEHEMITMVPIPQARRPRPRSIDLSSSSLAPRPVRRHSQPVPARSDEDWARDVRWLVPPPASPVRPPPSPHHAAPPHTPSPRRRSRPLHPDLLPPPGPALVIPAPHQLERHSFPDVPVVPQRPRSKARRSHRHSRGRMSALWEEDESECSTDVGASSAEVSRASTPAPVAAAEGYLSVHPGYEYEGRSATPPPGWPYTAGPGAGGGAGGSPTRRFMPLAMHRRASMSESELLQHLQVQRDTPLPSPGASPDSKLRDYARQHAQQHHRAMSTPLSSPSAPIISPARPASTTGHGLSASLPTHALPAPAFAGSASAGYTGLTLPHASYTPKHGRPQRDGHVDLVRAGRAQSSMATVEVVRGAAASLPAGSPLTRTRTRLSRGFSLSISRGKGKGARRRSHSREPEREREREKGKERARDGATPAHLRGALPLPVVFTAHVPPPAFVPGSHVLVQVFAVGVDALDSLVVQEQAERRGGAGAGKRRGFVPGRSFVGRAVECGFEVSRDVCRKGDWVLGLLDVRKCGALAEFVLVERHRVGSASGSGSSGRVFGTGGKGKAKRAVGYTWISVAVDMDEGEDVRDSLGAVVGMVEEGRVRPWLGSAEDGGEERVVPFEDAPEVFRRGAEGPVGVLKDGGTCAVKIGAY
ncbi:predicted protein [Postia placenta Mad-698-R]|nr:predicted protein [Postia placenta Mad-698-R]